MSFIVTIGDIRLNLFAENDLQKICKKTTSIVTI